MGRKRSCKNETLGCSKDSPCNICQHNNRRARNNEGTLIHDVLRNAIADYFDVNLHAGSPRLIPTILEKAKANGLVNPSAIFKQRGKQGPMAALLAIMEEKPKAVKVSSRALVQVLKEPRLAIVSTRIRQSEFRDQLAETDGPMCVLTGYSLDDCVASHLNLPGPFLSKTGVLLRRDIAHRFDYMDKKAIRRRATGELYFYCPDLEPYGLHNKDLRLSPERAEEIWLELSAIEGRT